jgi:hypothetical protein
MQVLGECERRVPGTLAGIIARLPRASVTIMAKDTLGMARRLHMPKEREQASSQSREDEVRVRFSRPGGKPRRLRESMVRVRDLLPGCFSHARRSSEESEMEYFLQSMSVVGFASGTTRGRDTTGLANGYPKRWREK